MKEVGREILGRGLGARRFGCCARGGFWPVVLLCLCILLLAQAPAVRGQDNATSTPDEKGFIYVEVQADDSLWSVAARAGLTIPELLELNELDDSVVLQPGDKLIVAVVEPPATPTSDIPTATLPPPSATPTAVQQRTAICISAYDDLNKDGIFDGGEPLRANVAFTVFNEQDVVANHVTDGVSEPHCLENLSPGVYHVTRSFLKNEQLTTEGDWALTLSAGSVLNLAFGSYTIDQTLSEPAVSEAEQLSTRLAPTTAPAPTAASANAASSLGAFSLMIGLAVVVFSLLVGMAVLIYLFVQKRNANE
jgi:LysM domain